MYAHLAYRIHKSLSKFQPSQVCRQQSDFRKNQLNILFLESEVIIVLS